MGSSKSSGKFYITTAIPYVNAQPHIGFAFELILTDVLARYRRMCGDDVYFLTGADENSLKNVQAAEREGIPVEELVKRNTQRFIDLVGALGISNDSFIRTSTPEHFAGSQQLWKACRPEDIYKKHYEGLYCVGCETFYQEKDLVDGKCPEHKTEPEHVEEENYFFKLSNYEKQLEELITSGEFEIWPDTRKNEVLGVIRSGLQDFSISRSMKRARNWGVPVPGDESQVMYVWFDAVANYITGIGYPNDMDAFGRYWPADVHVIGKGITRFHALYWAGMLLSAGIPLPKKLLVHGYVNVGGEKISKSLGNTVDPFALAGKYGIDAVRYYLTRDIPTDNDGDFTTERFEARYNSDLANDLGNLLSRTLTMIGKYCTDAEVDAPAIADDLGSVAADTVREYRELIEKNLLHQALAAVWNLVRRANTYIEEKAPWKAFKEGRTDEVLATMCNLWEALRYTAVMIAPVMPSKARQLWSQLGLTDISSGDENGIDTWGRYPRTFGVAKGDALFPRIDVKKKPAPQARPKQPKKQDPPADGTITIDEFKRVKLRTAVVVSAEKDPGSDKLLKLRVRLGDEERPLVAGVAQHYAPGDLIGREIVVVANLKPAKIRGNVSQGMLLAATAEDGSLAVLSPDKSVGGGRTVG